MTASGRYELAIQQSALVTRPDSVDAFLSELLAGSRLAKGDPSSGILLILHTTTDPVSARNLRRVFRKRRGALRSEGIEYFDHNQLRKIEEYRRWSSQQGPTPQSETVFQTSLTSTVDQAIRTSTTLGGRSPTLIISSDVFFSHQLRKSNETVSPLPTSMRTIRSAIDSLRPAQVEVVIHRYLPGPSFAGMYQTYVESGGTGDPGSCARLWLGRGDLDVDKWQAHVRAAVGVPDVRVLDCNPAISVADSIALLESLDVRMRLAMLPLDEQFLSLGRRRLSVKGSQILATINRSKPSPLQLKKSRQWVNSEFSGSAAEVSSEASRLIARI